MASWSLGETNKNKGHDNSLTGKQDDHVKPSRSLTSLDDLLSKSKLAWEEAGIEDVLPCHRKYEYMCGNDELPPSSCNQDKEIMGSRRSISLYERTAKLRSLSLSNIYDRSLQVGESGIKPTKFDTNDCRGGYQDNFENDAKKLINFQSDDPAHSNALPDNSVISNTDVYVINDVECQKLLYTSNTKESLSLTTPDKIKNLNQHKSNEISMDYPDESGIDSECSYTYDFDKLKSGNIMLDTSFLSNSETVLILDSDECEEVFDDILNSVVAKESIQKGKYISPTWKSIDPMVEMQTESHNFPGNSNQDDSPQTDPSSTTEEINVSINESHSTSSKHLISSSPLEDDNDVQTTTVEFPCLILRMPPEVMFRIFNFFTLEELFRLGAVCRYWSTIAHDTLLWRGRNVVIRRQCPIECAIALLSYAHEPKAVHISNYPGVNTLLSSPSFLTVSLKCLDLGFSELSVEILSLLFSGLMSHLSHLNLEGCRFVDERSVTDMCVMCPNLQRIQFSHCINVCDDTVRVLSKRLSVLTHVNVDGVEWISDQSVDTLVTAHGSHLEAIWLDGANLTNITVARLSHCPRLRLVSIRFCENLTDLSSIAGIESLTSLTLRKASQVTERDLDDLLNPAYSKLSNLVYLDLSECSGLKDGNVAQLVSLCGRTLCHQFLDWCWEVTDLGLDSIVDSCPRLEWLSLAGLHMLSGAPLRSFPILLPRLYVLNLANCNRIQDDIIQTLVDANPSLISFNYYGDRFETENGVRPELGSDHDLWRIADADYTRICNC